MTVYTEIESPVGPLLLVGEKDPDGSLRLASLSMAGQRHVPRIGAGWVADAEAFAEVTRQLAEYFSGDRTEFELEYALAGTEFQRTVWDSLDTIPHGTTTSYGALAGRLGLPRDRVQALGAGLVRRADAARRQHRALGSAARARPGVPRRGLTRHAVPGEQ